MRADLPKHICINWYIIMNKIRISPPRFKQPAYCSDSGLLLDPNIVYKKQAKAQHPAIRNVKIGNIDIVDDEVCDAFINLPESFSVLQSYYGDFLDDKFIDQGFSATCITAAIATNLSLELSKLLDFPFKIDYCLFLQEIYDTYQQYGYPRFGKFKINPDGSFYNPNNLYGYIPAIYIFGIGIESFAYTYAYKYLYTGCPIIVYPICDGVSKTISYDDGISYEALAVDGGLKYRPNCIQKPSQCGIKISLQNIKEYDPYKNICSIKQYLISNQGQSLSLSIRGSILKWLDYISSNPSNEDREFVYPIDNISFPEDNNPIGHQVSITGWTTPAPGYTRFIISNSWKGLDTFYITIKDTDYDNRQFPIFGKNPVLPCSYDILFVDYQHKSLEEIRSIFKDKIQECCMIGTCCGQKYNIDYCEENISEIECKKHKPDSLISDDNPDCAKPFFIPNRTLNNIFGNMENDNNPWALLIDAIEDESLIDDIEILTVSNPDTSGYAEYIAEKDLINRIILEFQRLGESEECPCCSPTPTETLSLEPN